MNARLLKPLREVTTRTPAGRRAVVALVLVAMIALGALPGYSSIHTRLLTTDRSQVELQALNVTPSYDQAHAVTQIISGGGGSLATTGADGTRFTLYVPVDGLLGAASVTMTPVDSVGGLPLSGGLAAAVKLEPAGLRLWKSATLVIEPPQAVSPDSETGFSWDEPGSDFHLFSLELPSRIQRENSSSAGLQLNPRGLVFKVLHFSGYGVGNATDADRAAQQQRPPSYSEAQFEQRLQAPASRERRRQLASRPSAEGLDADLQSAAADGEYQEDSEWVAEADKMLRDRYNNEIKPEMDAALESRDDARLKCAAGKALGWNRNAELLGMSGKFYDKATRKIFKFLRAALEIVADNSSKRCSQQKPEEVAVMLGIARQQELLGFDSSKTLENAQKCAKFEIEFDSEIDIKTAPATMSAHVHAKVPIKVEIGSAESASGTGPLEYFSFRFTPAEVCSATATTKNAELVVAGFSVDINPRQIGDCTTATSSSSFHLLSVDIEPGQPTETVTMICPPPPAGIGNFTLPASSHWFLFFANLHQDEQGEGGYKITGWEPVSGSLLARRTYSRDRSFGDASVTERTAMNLWHRPE
ncbi:MAG TPA: hypothetical protein VFV34_15175 [Blastocatellia bacterium]|nr:hypothetical protein [Blastocatellia bacterium]